MENTYIDENGKLHVIDENFAHLLPARCVVATQAQIASANAPIPPSLQEQIVLLEATCNARRIREAALGIDGGWLKILNDQITTLRSELK